MSVSGVWVEGHREKVEVGLLEWECLEQGKTKYLAGQLGLEQWELEQKECLAGAVLGLVQLGQETKTNQGWVEKQNRENEDGCWEW